MRSAGGAAGAAQAHRPRRLLPGPAAGHGRSRHPAPRRGGRVPRLLGHGRRGHPAVPEAPLRLLPRDRLCELRRRRRSHATRRGGDLHPRLRRHLGRRACARADPGPDSPDRVRLPQHSRGPLGAGDLPGDRAAGQDARHRGAGPDRDGHGAARRGHRDAASRLDPPARPGASAVRSRTRVAPGSLQPVRRRIAPSVLHAGDPRARLAHPPGADAARGVLRQHGAGPPRRQRGARRPAPGREDRRRRARRSRGGAAPRRVRVPGPPQRAPDAAHRVQHARGRREHAAHRDRHPRRLPER